MQSKINIPQSFAADFNARCQTMPNGCASYMGAHTVRIPHDVPSDVRFVSPRRAAYLIAHKQLPTREIKLLCHTPTCVNPAHFIEGRERSATPTTVDAKMIRRIQSETISRRQIAAKYKLSRNTVTKLLTDESAAKTAKLKATRSTG